MADKIERILLDYALGPGIQKTQAGLKALVGEQQQLKRALAETNKQALTSDQALAKVNSTLAGLARQKGVDQIATTFKTLAREVGLTNAVIDGLAADLARIGASDAEIQRVTRSIAGMADEAQRAQGSTSRVNALGGTDRGFSSLSALTRGLGATGAGEAAGLVADIAGAAEQLPLLKDSIVALGPAGLVAAAAVGAVGLAFAKMNADLEPARRALDAALEANRAYYEFLAGGGTTEQAQERIDELKRLADVERQIIADNNAAIEAAFRGAADTGGDFLARLAFQIGDADDKVTTSTDQASKSLAAYEGEIRRLEAGLNTGATAVNDLAASEEALAERRKEAAEKIAQLEAQRVELVSAAGDAQQTIEDDRRIRAERAGEDLNRALEDQSVTHSARLEAIAAQGQARLEQIKAQGNDRLAQADEQLARLQQSLADVTSRLNADRARIDRDFMASERAAVERFRQEEERADAAYNKARVRRLEDLNSELLDAEQSNDVVRFLAAKRRGEQDLRRLAVDSDDATRARQEAFDEARAQADAQRQQRLADLEAAAAERRADIEAQIQERRAVREELIKDIAAQLDAEKKRIVEAEKAEKETFDAQQKREAEARDLRNKRQQEDEDLADKRRRDALSKSLADIDRKINAERAAAGIVGASFTQMAVAIGGVVNQVLAAIRANASAASSSSTASGGGGGGTVAFARGGIVTQPTVAKMGERPGVHEAIIPFRPSEGLEIALARQGLGGSRNTFHFSNISVGAGVSERQLIEGLQEVAGVVVELLDKAG